MNNPERELWAALEDCVTLLEYIHENMGKHNCTTGCPDIGKRVRRGWAALNNVTAVANTEE